MSVATNLRWHIPAAVPLSVFRLLFPTQTLYAPGRVLHYATIPTLQLRAPVFTPRPGTTWNLAVLLDAIPVAFLQARRHDACPQP